MPHFCFVARAKAQAEAAKLGQVGRAAIAAQEKEAFQQKNLETFEEERGGH